MVEKTPFYREPRWRPSCELETTGERGTYKFVVREYSALDEEVLPETNPLLLQNRGD
jgi:hypothetical protein